MVSNEDREAAVAALKDLPCSHWQWAAACDLCVVDALIAHGWGPKPAVSAARIDEYMELAVMRRGASASAAVRELLRECGIEVTDD